MAAILIDFDEDDICAVFEINDEDAETTALEIATQTGKPYRRLPRD